MSTEERWQRVSGRNDAQGETYRVTVTRPMFDFIESSWQPPSPDEMAALGGVRVAWRLAGNAENRFTAIPANDLSTPPAVEASMPVVQPKMTIQAMIERLKALPTPPAVEKRDVEPLPERRGL